MQKAEHPVSGIQAVLPLDSKNGGIFSQALWLAHAEYYEKAQGLSTLILLMLAGLFKLLGLSLVPGGLLAGAGLASVLWLWSYRCSQRKAEWKKQFERVEHLR